MNIYYNPSDFGLELVGEFDWDEPDYSFNMLVVWKSGRGQYWVGEDSGCSCPSPFEDVRDVNELDGPYTKADLRKRINWMVDARDTSGYNSYSKATLKKFASDMLSRI